MTAAPQRFTTLERLGWTSLALTLVFGLGMLVDPRTLDGAPLWLKPAKFAVSIGIYSVTLAWMLRQLTEWPRVARAAAAMTSAAFVIELGLIAGQAARGVSSHFNVTSPVNIAIFAVMGTAIGLQTLASAAVTFALFKQPFADRALGWALRLGLLIAVLGASIGGLMTQPTQAQLAEVRATGVMPRAGQHSVGGEDGGPGLPGTGWSLEHGDLRVPHFLGLHAMQVLPLAALWLARRRARGELASLADRRMSGDTRVVVTAGASYAAIVAILLVQALVGQSVAAPAGAVLLALGAWAVASVAALAAAFGLRGRSLAITSHTMGVA